MATPKCKRGKVPSPACRISCGNGGAVEWIYDYVRLIGRFISFVNTARRPIPGLGKGVKSRKEEWLDTASVVWSKVTGWCGFWDGSCESGKCGAGDYDAGLRQNSWLGSCSKKKKCVLVRG